MPQGLMPRERAEGGGRAMALLYLGPATCVVLGTLLAPLGLLARYSAESA